MVQRSSSGSLTRQIQGLRRDLNRIRRDIQNLAELQNQLENTLMEIQDLKGIVESQYAKSQSLLPGNQQLPFAQQGQGNPLGAIAGLLQNVDIGEVIRLFNNPMVQDLVRNFLKRP